MLNLTHSLYTKYIKQTIKATVKQQKMKENPVKLKPNGLSHHAITQYQYHI